MRTALDSLGLRSRRPFCAPHEVPNALDMRKSFPTLCGQQAPKKKKWLLLLSGRQHSQQAEDSQNRRHDLKALDPGPLALGTIPSLTRDNSPHKPAQGNNTGCSNLEHSRLTLEGHEKLATCYRHPVLLPFLKTFTLALNRQPKKTSISAVSTQNKALPNVTLVNGLPRLHTSLFYRADMLFDDLVGSLQSMLQSIL
ncbi:MAG: hypothetical protein CSA33_08880 [Desulfobulbus propionicus]|nr:MAG: hypothetical protein CSA33_08880 [Desulfobulbus propionicus]